MDCLMCLQNKVYRNNKWVLCVSCYRKKLQTYKLSPSKCLASSCIDLLAMRNDSGLCSKHRHAKYMKDYICRPENIQKELESRRQYKKKNKTMIALKQKEREQNDISFKLKRRLRHRLYLALKQKNKLGSAVKDLGCTIEEIKKYLESRFRLGMSWDNWGSGENTWQVDHIKNLASFDLTNLEELQKACHYSNLQPLWYKDHLEKTKGELHHDGK